MIFFFSFPNRLLLGSSGGAFEEILVQADADKEEWVCPTDGVVLNSLKSQLWPDSVTPLKMLQLRDERV